MAERGRPQQNPYRRLHRAVLLAAIAACGAALLLLAAPMLAQRLEAVGRSTVETDHWMVLVASRIVASHSSLLQYVGGQATVDAALEPAQRALDDIDVAQSRASEGQRAQLVMLQEAVVGYAALVEAVRDADLAGDTDRAASLAAQAAESGAALVRWTEQVVEQNRNQSAETRDGSGAWVYRGVALVGVLCVACMLGALVWVVRMASHLTAPKPRSTQSSQPARAERVAQRASPEVEAAERRVSLMKRTLAVSQATAGFLDPDRLMRRAVGVIHQEFVPNCVGIFLVDEVAEAIKLQAGMCENGEAIASQGHSVARSEGRLGQCITTAQPYMSTELAEALLLRPNYEVQGSRTEVLLPLRDQGRTIGALVLQNLDPAAFAEDTVSVLQGLADQLASAIRAAQAYGETQATLGSVREALGQVSQDALLRALPGQVSGYRQLPRGSVEPVLGGWDEDMAQAVVEDRSIHQGRTLVIPIRVHDTTVGAVRLQKPEVVPTWGEREIELAGVVVEHLGHALESARLRAEMRSIDARSQLAHQVSEQLWAAPDWETLMQTAVQEIGRSVQASRVFVQWVTPTAGDSAAKPGSVADDEVEDQ